MILVERTMFKLEKSLKFLFLIKESKAKMCLKIPQKTYLLACPLSPQLLNHISCTLSDILKNGCVKAMAKESEEDF